jgi:uncharacterized membrane protein
MATQQAAVLLLIVIAVMMLAVLTLGGSAWTLLVMFGLQLFVLVKFVLPRDRHDQ